MERLTPRLRAHFLDPRRSGSLEGAQGCGAAVNAACGDDLRLGLWLEGARVARARFQASGCSSLVALASIACETLEGASRAELVELDLERVIADAGGLPARGSHARWVVQRAIDEAVRDLAARYPWSREP